VTAGSIRPRRPLPLGWAPWAAAIWALAFGGPHFYWGVGGSAGLDTALNRETIEHRDGWFLALNWGIGLLCVAGGVVALATVRPWGRRVPARLLRGLAWLGFVLLAARALDIYVELGRSLTGLTTVPAGQRAEYLRLARWFLFLWLPWFTLGAVTWGALAMRTPPQMPPREDAGPAVQPQHRR
jgi:Protein of unknown function (DUF3995)